MAIGLSLHIGIKKINPEHYAGSSGMLDGTEADARAMHALASNQGFTGKPVLTTEATRQKVISEIRAAASNLKGGDIFFISYSGHGGLLPNLNRDPESEGNDQSWCLFDGQLCDDELKNLWAGFKPGVRVLVISDSCFSGTILKFHGMVHNKAKILPTTILKQTYLNNKAFYDDILTRPNTPDNQIQASVLLLSSCTDNQQSLDGPFNSVFTEELINVWANGNFTGDYNVFASAIEDHTPSSQTPQIKVAGVPNNAFLNSKPFTI